MNAREQMQALIDGKVLMCDGNRYKLDDDGDLIEWQEWTSGGRWDKAGGDNFFLHEQNYIMDETKCVDFYHAIGKMSEGKIMRCLWSGLMFGIRDGAMQGYNANGWFALTQGELLEEEEMESKWIEVDE